MIGEAQGLLNHFQQAVQIYQDALNTIGLRERIVGLKNSLYDSLTYADYLASVGDYQSAFYAYRKLIRNRVNAYNQIRWSRLKKAITCPCSPIVTTQPWLQSCRRMI